MSIRRVCVFAASSDRCDASYLEAAARLGAALAQSGIDIIYGAGARGLMGHLADAALAEGGTVIGVLPRFMERQKWGHSGLTELCIVDDMHARKQRMLKDTDAVVALPGGVGTLEELFEAIAWKQLGLFSGPIAMVNTNGFYDTCVELLGRCISGRFMNPVHGTMWIQVQSPEDVVQALEEAPPWDPDPIRFAEAQ
ncbi:MAG: TIGR00730 family Rossman fold protein [Candidatus Latescibacteria bacterium]|jgi:hypothetical protein|nr:TIGR00730 family Rossman fold protein [Candidatus Latescibacterota bacterium]